FKEHRDALFAAIDLYGERLGISKDKLLYECGSLAVKLGFTKVGEEALRLVRPDSREYNDALQVLLVLAGDRNDPAAKTYFREMEKTQNWRARIDLLRQYLARCRERAGGQDIRRPALNEIL